MGVGAPLRASIVAAAALSVKMMYVKMERSADHSDAMTCYIGAVSAGWSESAGLGRWPESITQ